MTVESSIRYGTQSRFAPIFNHGGNAQHYGTPEPYETRDVDWRWKQLWEQENPNPALDPDGAYVEEGFKAWFERSWRMGQICWARDHFPQFRLMDWDPDGEDMTALLRLVSRHVCGVCGRVDDPGCSEGC